MAKQLSDYRVEYEALSEKCNLSGDKAIEAVKQDGYALQFVKEKMFGTNNN